MLIERTPWLKLGYPGYTNHGFFHKRRNAYNPCLYVCYNGLRRLFKIPDDIKRVRFYVYDKPTKNSVEFKLAFNDDGDACLMYFRRSIEVPIYAYMLDRRIRKLLSRQNRYYVECEYL